MSEADSRQVAGEEAARRRIGREIHDDLSQRLAALAFEVRRVRTQLPEASPQRIDLDGVGAHLAEVADDLRHLSHDLHPAVLERRGLTEALRDHCGEVEQRHGLRVGLSLRDEAGDPLPPDFALGLYRIVQEALANTVRHAGARTAQVTLSLAGGVAHLEVVDDGAGFDPEAARQAGGLGLASLDERARLFGGRCRITSSSGAGTRIEVSVPLPVPRPHRLRRLGNRGLLIAAALMLLALLMGLVGFWLRRAAPGPRRSGDSPRGS